MMHRFGYYVTESSEHSSEYVPYFIKAAYPELIEEFNIPLDEYPRRCVEQIEGWEADARGPRRNKALTHTRHARVRLLHHGSHGDQRPVQIGGNVPNTD